MLKNFIYLNGPQLDQYLSALEDGLRESAESSVTTSGSKSGSAGASLAGTGARAEGATAHSENEILTRADTRSSRFERLQRLARADVESSGWVDVLDIDEHLPTVGVGAIIELECEIYVPDAVKMIAASGGMLEALAQMQAIMPAASTLGLDTDGLPDAGELDAMSRLLEGMKADVVMIGEVEDARWKVAGTLSDKHLLGEVDGYARVVGKVSSVLPAGKAKPLLALPGSTLIPRDERRKMEQAGPQPGDEDSWLTGPAVMLDILAVYR